MEYNNKDLYRLNIFQLREMGKSVNLKGVTNKSKDDLIAAIAKLSGQEPPKRSAMAMLVNKLNTKEAKSNFIKGIFNGLVLVEDGECFCRIYDKNFILIDIIITIDTVNELGIVDGDFIEFKASMCDGIKFVSNIMSINNQCTPHVSNCHSRELYLVDNTLGFILDNVKDNQQKSICVLPLCTQDEISRLERKELAYIVRSIFDNDESNYNIARLAIASVRQQAQMGDKISVYIDLDRVYTALHTVLDAKVALMKLRKIFASSVEYSNNGSVKIIGLVTQQDLYENLKSWATTLKNVTDSIV